MPDSTYVEKAILQEIHWDQDNRAVVTNPDNDYTVQFNPETLKLAFSNQFANNDDSGGAAIQFVSKGTTKLSVDLILDVTVPVMAGSRADMQGSGTNDVRILSSKISYFMRAQRDESSDEPRQKVPGVRFHWGSFLFDGVMESINETLEYFSADGRPLRATLSISLVKQDLDVKPSEMKSGRGGAAANSPAATHPQQTARQGESLQALAARLGKATAWQHIALANNIENPRQLVAGTLVDATVTARNPIRRR